MTPRARLILPWPSLLLALFASLATAQQPVFHASSELVQIPVTVLNRHGDFVGGLKRRDFTLRLDGREVPIAAVDEQRFSEAPPPLPALPPHAFTNQQATQARHRLILLIDYAHSSGRDLLNLQRNLKNWLKKPLPAGEQVAIFQLDSDIRLIQPFTRHRADLLDALQGMTGGHRRRGELAGIRRELQILQGLGANITGELFHGPPPAYTVHGREGGSGAVDEAQAADTAAEGAMLGRMQQVADRSQAINMLDLFQRFAHLLAGVPGRKNVVWLTGNTTLLNAFSPDLAISNARVRHVFALLDGAGVALFPVDITGLQTFSGAPAAIRGRDLEDAQMDWAASQTGGRAFTGSNDVGPQLTQIETITASEYTLSFVPPELPGHGLIRRLKVSVRRPGLKVLYRRSYLAPSQASARADRQQFYQDLGELAYNPLPLGSLTVAVSTGTPRQVTRRRYFAEERPGPRRPGIAVPFALVAAFAPLVHQAPNGRRFYDFSFLRLIVPLDGSTPPLLLPVVHYHAVLATGSNVTHRATLVRSEVIVPAGHPYLTRVILRDNVDGKAGSISFRLGASPSSPRSGISSPRRRASPRRGERQ